MRDKNDFSVEVKKLKFTPTVYLLATKLPNREKLFIKIVESEFHQTEFYSVTHLHKPTSKIVLLTDEA
jgi:hypothetical protein